MSYYRYKLSIGLIAALVMVIVAGCGGGGKTDVTFPTITGVHADLPAGFDFNGGKIGLYATVQDNAAVSRVFANLVKDGTASPIVWLTAASGSEYSATNITIAGNATDKSQSYSIHVWAQDTGGNVTETTTAAFAVPPAGGSNPPSPPNI